MTDAASPTTNTPGASTTFRNGSTSARPARSVLVPSIFGIGDAATPAVHSTVALGILLPPAITPLSSTVSTLTPVRTRSEERRVGKEGWIWGVHKYCRK